MIDSNSGKKVKLITQHQYLDKYPISINSDKLILGTIHPHEHEKFDLPFFYGNRLSIWKILNAAFNFEMGNPITLKGIERFLENHNISVSDTIRKCKRINTNAADKDLLDLELNFDLVDQIRKSKIKEILFTSGFQKNNAFKLFYSDILKLEITKDIIETRETILDESILGRPIKLTILISPSGSANISISKSKLYLENRHKYLGLSPKPIMAFKIDYYRNKFKMK